MNDVPRRRSTLTMSSLEIAKLTRRRHDNVLRDIRNMIASLGGAGALRIEEFKNRDLTGESTSHFMLPKRECIILVSGYDVTMRAKIVDRWMQLERIVAEADAATIRKKPLSAAAEDRALRRIREIRLTHGIRMAQRAWLTSGLPIYEGMLPPEQGDLLDPPDGHKH